MPSEKHPPCPCGDAGEVLVGEKWRCKECAVELHSGKIPKLYKGPNVPYGVTITRLGRSPGTGEGEDYFGNHT